MKDFAPNRLLPRPLAQAIQRLDHALLRLPPGVFLIIASLVAVGIGLCLFAPRLVVWTGLFYRAGLWNADVGRAFETLRQLEDPCVRITTDANGVIRWRLLFPLIGYAIRLPPEAFLALPPLGCLLTSAAIVAIVSKRTGSRLTGFVSAVLLCTTSWFQVSTGWLAYFDAWYLLALMAVAFAPGLGAMTAACLLAPWVDERFVIGLPLALLVRFAAASGDRNPRRALGEIAACGVALVPFAAIRLGAACIAAEDGSGDYLFRHLVAGDNLPRGAVHLLAGLWNGWRFAWPFALAWGVAAIRQAQGLERLVLVGGLAATLVTSIVIAGDLSRSMAIWLPAVVAGIGSVAATQRIGGAAILVATLLNGLAPAWHVTADFTTRIHSLPYELGRLSPPPAFLTSGWNNRRGLDHHQAGRFAEAFHHFDAAVRLDPEAVAPLLNRAVAAIDLGQAALARADLIQVLSLAPRGSGEQFHAERLLARLREAHERVPGGPPFGSQAKPSRP
jgi:tetratricopeptide (TPR) repeat protein